MKIVQINTVCEKGSTGRIDVNISKILTENGIENYIFYGSGHSDYEFGYKFQGNLYLKFNVLLTRLFGKHGFYSHFATYKLLKKLDEINPDVIHLHNIHGHYVNVRMLFNYIKKHNKKVIWTLHDCWAFTGHCSHFDYIGCNKWKTGCHHCLQKNMYPVSWFFDRSKESYRDKKKLFCGVKNMTIVTPSEWLKGKVKESFLKEYPVIVINNGIDLEKFRYTESDLKEKLGLSNKKIILGICFKLHDRKGGDYLVELAKKLSDDERMVILGLETDEKLPENITVLAKTHSIEELAKIYSMADVFVNTSLEETFPTVNIEALACGTPVVTFASGGSGEIVDSRTGAIVFEKNVDILYNKITQIVFSEKKNDSYLRNRTEKLYSDVHQFKEYVKLYNEI
ncbi:MAG: glycosyltransferase [Clostridia bacterium]|nr:glycosyltransferase [Clostridia bacterium]